MKTKKIQITLFLLFTAMLLTACTGNLTGSNWPGVSATDDTIYVANANTVYAVRASDGQQIWKFPAKASQTMYYAAPVVADGQVLVGDYKNVLHALDVNTGSEIWTFEGAGGRYIAGPLVTDSTILAPNGDGSLYALDLNGNLQWKFETNRGLWSQPVSDGKMIYISSMDHHLYALSLTGDLAWSVDLGGSLVYSPTQSPDGVLYVTTIAHKLFSIDPSNGNILWEKEFEKGLWSQPAYHEGTLYIGDLNGSVYALSAADGSNQLVQNLGQEAVKEVVTGQPVIISNGVVVTTENGMVTLISFAGVRLWTHGISANIYSSPVMVGENLAIGLTKGDNFLILLNQNGQRVWSFTPSKD